MFLDLAIRKVRIKYILLIIILGIFTTSCKSTQLDTTYIKTELYFGLSELNGTMVSPQQWNDFKVNTLDKSLSGYTEVDSKGFWTSDNNVSVSQNSKLIIYLNKGTEEDILTVEKIITAYKIKFKQQSVLKINHTVKASF